MCHKYKYIKYYVKKINKNLLINNKKHKISKLLFHFYCEMSYNEGDEVTMYNIV